jgi:hypothetical protein
MAVIRKELEYHEILQKCCWYTEFGECYDGKMSKKQRQLVMASSVKILVCLGIKCFLNSQSY